MRFLLDQCLPRSAVNAIEEEGHQAVHCSDCGLSRALDEGFGMRDAGFGIRDAGCGMRDSGCGMWDAR